MKTTQKGIEEKKMIELGRKIDNSAIIVRPY